MAVHTRLTDQAKAMLSKSLRAVNVMINSYLMKTSLRNRFYDEPCLRRKAPFAS